MADAQTPPPERRYGPTAFVAAVVTVAVVGTATWMWTPYVFFSLYSFAVASAIVLPVAGLLMLIGGKAVQAGRGVLIGYLATPLTAAIVSLPMVVFTALRHPM